MKVLHYTTQYKKDFKKYRNQPKEFEKLLAVLRMLENEEELSPEFKAHRLIGQYKDCIECHLEEDFLLIWFDKTVIA